MKKLLFNLSFVFLSILISAQTPNYNIVVTQSTNGDTLLMDLLGVISGPLPNPSSPSPDITSQLQDIGVTSIRNNDNRNDKLDMEALFRCSNCFANPYQNTHWVPAWCCNPTDTNNLHFEASDTLFRAIKNGGFNLFFRLGGERQSALSNQNHIFQGPQDTVAENNWIKATVPVVEHYDNFENSTNQLNYLDIWTEWPNQDFFERSDSEFIWFFTKALDTLKTHFPNKKIGGPGFLVPTEMVIQGSVNNKATDLLSSLYDHNIKPDFISWHLWSLDPEDYYMAGENFRRLLNGVWPFNSVPWAGTGFFSDVEIICGAWGTPKIDNGIPLSESEKYLLYNTQKGAALLTADWIAMQETNTVKAFYYRCADIPSSDPDTTIGNVGTSGLFYGNAAVTYKPNAYAFKLWNRIYKEFPQKLSCSFPVYASDSSKLWALAAKNNINAYALLISNTDSIVKTYTLNIQGQTVDTTHFDIYYFVVNNNENGDIQHQSFDNNFSIAEQTVELIKVLPKNYTGFIENEIKKVKIYPNPSFGTIHLENIINLKIDIVNIYGEIVYNSNLFKANATTINLSGLVSGVYFIRCWDVFGNDIKNFKIIINKHN